MLNLHLFVQIKRDPLNTNERFAYLFIVIKIPLFSFFSNNLYVTGNKYITMSTAF